eukprot:4915242-Karenia_brevis.AAC.1
MEKEEFIAEHNTKKFTAENSILETELAASQLDQQNANAQLAEMQKMFGLNEEELIAAIAHGHAEQQQYQALRNTLSTLLQ